MMTIYLMIESMVCQAYGSLNKSNVNDIRYKKCYRGKFPEPSKISPTEGELYQHVNNQDLFGRARQKQTKKQMDMIHVDDGWSLLISLNGQYNWHIYIYIYM